METLCQGVKETLSFLNQSQDHLSGKSMNYLLREFGTEDVDAIYELTSQPEVYKFLPDWRSTRELCLLSAVKIT